jgi:CBS domain-containing protein
MRKTVADVMTNRPRCATPDASLQEVAEIMEVEDVGAVPLVEGERLVAMITDRDIVIRAIAHGNDPRTMSARSAASQDLIAVRSDQDLDEALKLMARNQVRRLPVVAEGDRLVGILAQADVALESKEKATGELLGGISQPPSGPRLAGQGSSAPKMADIWTYREQTWAALDLSGYHVAAIDGGIGKVDEASDEIGEGYIVVDTGPWIFGKKVLLPAGVIGQVDRDDEQVFVNRTKDEIKNAPEFDQDRYRDDDYRGQLGSYYDQGGPGWRDS